VIGRFIVRVRLWCAFHIIEQHRRDLVGTMIGISKGFQVFILDGVVHFCELVRMIEK